MYYLKKLTQLFVWFLVLVVVPFCLGMLCCTGKAQEKPTLTPYQAILKKDGKERADEFKDAVDTNIRFGDNKYRLVAIVAAIRFAENGGPGREYGVLHPRVKPTYRSQAGWCAATVQKNWDRYIKAGLNPTDIVGYIAFLGKKYCPVGAKNDPHGLNRHWIRNVTRLNRTMSK
tara:strand:+ start:108 stop:626 length:519 start_codon:yes stop_codon:yes gene_type:complete